MGDTLEDGVDLGDVTSALEKVGISALDENGKMRDVGNIMEDLMGVWSQMDQTQKAAIATTLAGKYQLTRFEALMNRSDLYQQYKQASEEGKEKGTLDVMNEKYVDSLEGRLNKLQATFEGLFSNLFETTDFNPLIDGLTNVVDLMNQFVTSIGGGTTALTGLGAVAMRVFSNSMARGLNNFVSNRQAAQKKKENQRNFAENGLASLGLKDVQGESNKKFVDVIQNNLKVTDSMSTEQAQEYNQKVETAVQLKNQQIDKEQELYRLALAINAIWDETLIDITRAEDGSLKVDLSKYQSIIQSSSGRDLIDSIASEQDTIKNSADTYAKQYAAMSSLKKRTNIEITGDESLENLHAFQRELIQFRDSIKKTYDIADLGDAQVKEDLNNLIAILGSLNEKTLDTEESANKLQKAFDNIQASTSKAGSTFAEMATSKTVRDKTAKTDIHEAVDAASSSKEFANQAVRGVETEGDKLKDQGETRDIINTVSAIGDLAFAWQSFQNLGSLWANNDITDGEKLQQTIMNLTASLPMLISGMYELNRISKTGVFEKTSENLSNKSKTSFEQANITNATMALNGYSGALVLASAKSTGLGIASKVAAGGVKILGTAISALSGPLGIAIELGGMFYSIFKQYKDQEWQNTVDSSAKKAEEAKSLLDTLSSSGKQFDNLYQKYKNGENVSSDLKSVADTLNEALDDQQLKVLAAAGAWEQYNNRLDELSKQKAADSVEKINANASVTRQDLEKATNSQEEWSSSGIANKKYSVDYEVEKQASGIVRSINGSWGFKGGTDLQTSLRDLDKAKELYNKAIEETSKQLSEADKGSETYTAINAELVDLQNSYDKLNSLENSIADKREAYNNAIDEEVSTQVEAKKDDSAYQYQEGQSLDEYKDVLRNTDEYKRWVADEGTSKAEEMLDSFVSGMAQVDTTQGKELAKRYAKEKAEESFGQGLYSAFENSQATSNLSALSQSQVKGQVAASAYTKDNIDFEGNNLQQALANLQMSSTVFGSVDTDKLTNEIYDSLVSSIIDKVNNSSLSEEDKQKLMTSLDWSQPLDQILGTIGQSVETGKIQSNFDENSDQNDRKSRLKEEYKVDDNTITAYEDVQKQSDKVIETQQELQNALDKTAEEFGSESKEAKKAEKKLDGYNDSVEDLADLALQSQKGMERLSESIEDNAKVIRKGDKNSIEYAEAISETRDAVADLLNVSSEDLSVNFVENNLDDIEKAAYGDVDAIQRLRAAAAEEILVKISKDPESNLSAEELDYLQQKAWELSSLTIEPYAMLDDQDFIDTLNGMLESGKLTADQVNSYLNAIGYDPNIEMEEVTSTMFTIPGKHIPITISNIGEIGGIDLPDIDIQGTVKVPKITSVDAVGSGSGYTPVSSKAAGNRPTSSGGGGGGGGKGGGGGGGSDDNFDDSQKDFLEDELDLYERVNTELSKMEKHLDGLDQEYDRLIGYNKANNMNKQIQDYHELIRLAKQKLEIQQQEAQDIRGKLSGYGVQFNGEGIITNYAQIFNQLKGEYDSLVSAFNSSTDKAYKEGLSDQMEEAEKSFDKFKDYIDRYDTLIGDEIKSSLNQIEEYYDKIEDLRIQAFNDAMDAVDNIQDLNDTMSELKGLWTGLSSDSPFRKMIEDASKLEDYFNLAAGAADKYYDTIINDYKKAAEQATDDTAKNFALQQASFWQARKSNAANEIGTENGTGLLDMRLSDLEAVLKYFNGTDEDRKNSIWGDNEAAALEALETAYKNLAQAELDAAAQAESLLQDIIDGYEKIGDEFDKMSEAYENLSDTIDHYSNMVESLYGEEDYDRLLALMETKQNTLLQNIRFQQSQVQYWEQELAKYDKETEREKWEEVHSQLVDAQKDMNDLAENAAENLANIYETQTDKFLSDWKNKLLGGDADFAEMQWELSKKNAELYLDDVERAYNIEKLRAKYQQMLNNTTDPSIQRQIADAMNEQVSALQERVKLSQYDVDYANAQLEILQKRIALEEAQRNKSQMKLKRDAQGNYSYVYTANKDNVDNAQSDLLDSEQNAYELTKNNAISLQENYFSALNDYAEKARQIREKNKGDEATMKEQLQALWDSYKEYLTGLAQQLGVTQADMIESVRQMSEDSQGELSDYYTNIADAMENNWSEAMDNIGISTSSTVIAQLQDLTSLEQATNDLINNFNRSAAEYGDYVNKIEQDTQTSYGNVDELIDGVIDKQKALTDATEDFWNLVRQDTDQINKNNAALISYREEIEKLQDSTSKANQAMREAQELAAAKEQQARDWESKYTELKTAVDNGSYFNKGGSGSGGGSVSSEEAAFGIAQNIWTYGSWANDPVRRDRIISRYGEDVANRAQEIVNDYYYSGRAGELYNTDSWSWGYDTGGYTGTWSDKTDEPKNGKLAYLHQKELVLNESDTQNILDAVSLVREFTKQLKSNSLGSLFDFWGSNYAKKDNEQTVKQDVHITAEFPNVNSATEIETALESLNQRAYQYVQKYR